MQTRIYLSICTYLVLVALGSCAYFGGINKLKAEVSHRASDGVVAVEAPRGILFHHYEYDENGIIVKANCVVPTTQNNANIHLDLQSFARQFAVKGMTDDKMELL